MTCISKQHITYSGFSAWQYILFIVFWVVGFFSGVVSAFRADESVISMVLSAPEHSVSFLWLITGIGLLLLVPAFTVSFSLWWLPSVMALISAHSFGLCLVLIRLAFGPSAWIAVLLLLPSVFVVPAFCWLSLQVLHNPAGELKYPFFHALMISTVIAALYCFIIFPFGKRISHIG